MGQSIAHTTQRIMTFNKFVVSGKSLSLRGSEHGNMPLTIPNIKSQNLLPYANTVHYCSVILYSYYTTSQHVLILYIIAMCMARWQLALKTAWSFQLSPVGCVIALYR